MCSVHGTLKDIVGIYTADEVATASGGMKL